MYSDINHQRLMDWSGSGRADWGTGDPLVAHVLVNTIAIMQVRQPQPQKYPTPSRLRTTVAA